MFSYTNGQWFLIIESLLKLLLSNYRIKLYIYLLNYYIHTTEQESIIIDRLLIIGTGEKN